VGDLRESPALKLIELLRDAGANLSYHDPHVPSLDGESIELESVELTDGALRSADVVCVVTAHAAVDHTRVAELAQLVVDFRNAVPAGRSTVVSL